MYGGTLVVDGPGGFLLFEDDYIAEFKRISVRDDRVLADGLPCRHLPDAGPIQHVIMSLHNGPIIF
ncbi:hypothetical protein [Futiania mangrovi]|uniref:Uncharacterized protein n=1 Tax=Futiania mangrovi TaxID=2959716 RepID=A0A9J6P9F2_9PROT|nr:hypothetical protein [Futiania mangrovii]MCP1335477.1 hypothetical protein [Futiania mangrovii]